MPREFYSHGKLLLSGEYAILDGALGLAIPTKFGQSLKFTPSPYNLLDWKSFDSDGQPWFEAKLELPKFKISSTTDQETADRLLEILATAKTLNNSFLESGGGLVETNLTFPRNWGLGTSSTVVNNLANWAEVDPYLLLQKTFGGSGYDIACAQHSSPITYQLQNGQPKVQKVDFDPPYKEKLFFVYLNQKRNSREAISNYRSLQFEKSLLVEKLSALTTKMIKCSTLDEFDSLLDEHEELLSKVLGIPPVKSKLFSDYSGATKSLGAWGGDFILATGSQKHQAYFKEKGYSTILPYTELAL
ncbi:GYDIA family GHMP kinase [Flagellimonas myxillae]|uniref:GYDIA family GHMP kinase n=1 Tax=Flagellimonas myxillae TaxID=2942214 RepID=UPI00201EF873|nr:GYDIA family GHMP kinase [Muricauda myxillae]MCL6267679.1 GYDIA family GHMP kinase [Muricauda myxillae]